MFAWVSATTRLVQWALLAGVVATTLVLDAILTVAGIAFPVVLSSVVAGAIAAAVPASLDDPAVSLLAPVATTCRRRLAHRLAIVVPASLVCWLIVAALVENRDRLLTTVPQMGALVAVGVATTCIVGVSRTDVSAAAGAAAPVTLATGSVWFPTERLADAAAVWSVHPWPVIAFAAAVAIIGTERAEPTTRFRRGQRSTAAAT